MDEWESKHLLCVLQRETHARMRLEVENAELRRAAETEGGEREGRPAAAKENGDVGKVAVEESKSGGGLWGYISGA